MKEINFTFEAFSALEVTLCLIQDYNIIGYNINYNIVVLLKLHTMKKVQYSVCAV